MRASIRLSCLSIGLLTLAACAPLAPHRDPLTPRAWTQGMTAAPLPGAESGTPAAQPASLTIRGQSGGANSTQPAQRAVYPAQRGTTTYAPVVQTNFDAPPLPATNGATATIGQPVANPATTGTSLPEFISPNAVEPYVGPNFGGDGGAQVVNPDGIVVVDDPYHTVDVDVGVAETETGRFMFGVGVNSDAGLTGNIVIDERNFDLFAAPRSWSDVAEGRAFRGGGQGFRIEALPGTSVQRYMVNFSEPYLMGTRVSMNVSGSFFDRRFFDWDEQRFGGRLGFGYRLSPDLSVSASGRAENVNIHDPRVVGVPQLDRVIGKSDLFGGKVSLTHDTRDVPFAPTEGHMLEMSFEQVFGTFDYSRATLDARRYFLISERADGSGRHTLGFSLKTGFSGADTPIFENFFAGGFSTLRGFDFRGASPVVSGVVVGGRFQLLGSVEYMLSLTADDMLRGVVFCDYGTVEEDIEIDANNFRVAPGFGLRIFVPAMGPAPIALDFAFPVIHADSDSTQVFSFFVGFGR